MSKFFNVVKQKVLYSIKLEARIINVVKSDLQTIVTFDFNFKILSWCCNVYAAVRQEQHAMPII